MCIPARFHAPDLRLRALWALQSLQQLRAEGYVRGGTSDCTVIGFDSRWYDPQKVRFFDDEPSRHRMMDLAVPSPPPPSPSHPG